MARSGIIATLGSNLGDGQFQFTHKGSDGGTVLASTLATAVADGATPTQAHVTAVNNAIAAVQGDVHLSWDAAKITTVNQLKRAFDKFLQAARASGMTEA